MNFPGVGNFNLKVKVKQISEARQQNRSHYECSEPESLQPMLQNKNAGLWGTEALIL